jgi:hypothetical protein
MTKGVLGSGVGGYILQYHRKEYHQAYYQQNKERILKYGKKYYQDHKEKLRAEQKRRYYENKKIVKTMGQNGLEWRMKELRDELNKFINELGKIKAVNPSGHFP